MSASRPEISRATVGAFLSAHLERLRGSLAPRRERIESYARSVR